MISASFTYDGGHCSHRYAEWECMRSVNSQGGGMRYAIYRVSLSSAEAGGARITIIEEPLRAIQEGSLRLCIAV